MVQKSAFICELILSFNWNSPNQGVTITEGLSKQQIHRIHISPVMDIELHVVELKLNNTIHVLICTEQSWQKGNTS